MSRVVKTLKDKNGNEVEVYSDNCIICSAEMIFPKKDADSMEYLFPFLKEKIDKGSPCLECFNKKLEEDKNYSMFSEDEINSLQAQFADRQKD